jgi:hypothetical protein
MTKVEQACEQVRRVSQRLATWIRKQSAIGEESATDWLLYELSNRLPFLLYKKFTRHQESRESGADWDWWFILRRGSIGFRVQAKKVISGADHYRGLAHTSRAGLQMELLLESARTANLLAFYALYSGGASGSNTMCGGGLGAFPDEGVFLAAAPTLYEQFIEAGRSRVEANALLDCSNPLSCLFCCPMVRESVHGDPDGFYHYIENYYPGVLPDSKNDNEGRRGFHAEPPPHVLSLIRFNEDIPDGWEEEHLSAVRDTKAVVVLDLRGVDEG